jgi:DNA-binding transcriptional ArsR family regulator
MRAPVPIPPTTNPGPDLAKIELATVLHALSDPVRLLIVRQVDAQGPDCEIGCGELELPVSKSTGSHHLKHLLESGITAEREEGTRKFIRLRRDELERRFPGLMDSVLRAAATP